MIRTVFSRGVAPGLRTLARTPLSSSLCSPFSRSLTMSVRGNLRTPARTIKKRLPCQTRSFTSLTTLHRAACASRTVTRSSQALRRLSSRAAPASIISTPWSELAPGMSATQKMFWTLLGASGLAGIGCVAFAGNQGVYTLDDYAPWPEHVAARFRSTYAYLAGGITITAASSLLLFGSPIHVRMMALSPWMSLGASLALVCVPMIAMMAIDGNESPVAKHAAYVAFNSCMGLTLCSLGFVGAPIIMQAAVSTGLMVGSLSLVAANAPSEQFLWMGGPLTVGLGVCVCASVGQMFFPASSMLHHVVLYGGLGLFGGFVLYDTNKVIQHCKYDAEYDAINGQVGIYLDIINIFVRMVQIFGDKKK